MLTNLENGLADDGSVIQLTDLGLRGIYTLSVSLLF